MARDGSPDDPNNYSDSDYQQSGHQPQTGYGQYPPPEPTPWYRKPAGLVGLGVLSAVVLALLVYAVVKFADSSGSSPDTSTTSSTSSPGATSSSVPVAPGPGGQ